jgi:peptidoglycan/xylan/chitin deacetylase (PgdA/CDA1 family)
MLKQLKQRLFPRLCSYIPLNAWHRMSGVELVIPYWHVVSDHDLPHVSGISRYRNIRQFKSDIEFFLKRYSVISELDLINHLDGKGNLPPRPVLLTFDDGFREIHDIVAPLLRAAGASATFFLISSSVDNQHLCYTQKKSLLTGKLTDELSSATWGEVTRLLTSAGVPGHSTLASRVRGVSYRKRKVLDDVAVILGCDFQDYLRSARPYVTSDEVRSLLNQGFAIGAHSVDHPLYSELTLEEQLVQTRESMRYLSEQFHLRCQSFAFPYHANGVSLEFFDKMFADGELRVSFGTGGLIPHAFRRHLSRCTPELSNATAQQALARDFYHAVIPSRVEGSAASYGS